MADSKKTCICRWGVGNTRITGKDWAAVPCDQPVADFLSFGKCSACFSGGHTQHILRSQPASGAPKQS
jgi:hypothetical protein